MRVPTYANYMNLSSAIKQNNSLVDKYTYQSVSGLKHQNYSGYGMSAYNIVSMESTLAVTNTFMDNNQLANISLNTSNLAIQGITDALAAMKACLNDFCSANISNLKPDGSNGQEYMLNLQNMQNLAFSTLQMIADTLNTNVSGKYIYGGGSTTAPVKFEFRNLDEFQKYYDGIRTLYPSTSSAVLSNFSIDSSRTGNIEFIPDAGGEDKGTIKALGGSFLEPAVSMNAGNVGTVSFDSSTNTMKATEYGAFSSLSVGDSIVINGSSSDLGSNAKAYVIKSISADGRTVTFEDSTPVETSVVTVPNNDIVINKTFPIGSVINLSGFDNRNLAPNAMVTGISDDGTELYVSVDAARFPSMTVTDGKWSIGAEAYYKGGSLEYNQRISESQTISFDVKASDPAFEKIFRALGQVAQGNLVDFSDLDADGNVNTQKANTLANEALELIASAIGGFGDVTQDKNASLYSITAKISSDYTILNKVMDSQKVAAANLENNIGSLKDVDKQEAAVKLLLAENALEASYSVLSSVSKLSLLNYMK